MASAPHVLLVEARYYEDISEELARGAIAEIEAAGATFDRVSVPGALEIPGAIAFASEAEDANGLPLYDGFVALGCVIRGETSHYDLVAGESARGLMDLSTQRLLAVGNGIITVENYDQAWARAKVGQLNKGGGAARAALDMIRLSRRFLGED